MKKVICLLTVLMLCLSVAMPAFATSATGAFVPSITYKPEPEIVPVVDDKGQEFIGTIIDTVGEVVDLVETGCLDVTPIAYVWDEEKDVPEEVEELLVTVYDALFSGSMKLPYEKLFNTNSDANAGTTPGSNAGTTPGTNAGTTPGSNAGNNAGNNAGTDSGTNSGSDIVPEDMVIRDLFEAHFICEECESRVAHEGVTFEMTFDLGVMPGIDVVVMTYDEEADDWDPIVKTVNNGDGTVTCTFEHLCAIVFSLPRAALYAPTEEVARPSILPWVIVLVVAVIAFVVLLAAKKKKKKTEA